MMSWFKSFGLILFIVFSATFSNISAILWWPVLVVEEEGQPLTIGKQLVNFITKSVTGLRSTYMYIFFVV